jgi:hypothetical protein
MSVFLRVFILVDIKKLVKNMLILVASDPDPVPQTSGFFFGGRVRIPNTHPKLNKTKSLSILNCRHKKK